MHPKPELWAAAEQNDTAKVDELLCQGKDPDEKFQGWTPLMKASEEGNIETMALLLNTGRVDIEAENKKGRTALSFACAPSNNEGIRREARIGAIELLLRWKADPEHKDHRNNTPKDYAIREHREDALRVLLEMNSIKSEH